MQTHPDFGSVQLLHGGEATIGPDWSSDRAPPYRSATHVLYHLTAGACEVEIDGVWRELVPGPLYLLTAGRWHRRRCAISARQRFLHVRLPSLSLDLLLAAATPLAVFPAVQAAPWIEAMALVPSVMDELRRPRPAGGCDVRHRWRIAGTVQEIAAATLPPLGDGGPGGDDAVSRAVAFIDRHYRTRPALSAVARAAGCSARLLHDRFVARFGRTAAAYAEERRLQDAERLLRATDLPVQEVARRCGYPDPLHFSRVVRRRFGCSPLDVRRG